MSPNNVIFIAVNLGITAEYAIMACIISLDLLRFRLKLTKYGLISFFVLCGYTHFEMVYHTWVQVPGVAVEKIELWHMVLPHVGQFIAVGSVIIGFYRETVLTGRPFTNVDPLMDGHTVLIVPHPRPATDTVIEAAYQKAVQDGDFLDRSQ